MSSLAMRRGARYAVPTGKVKIDWGHPLARGLIACYLPGISGGIDLCGIGPQLTPRSGGVPDMSVEGPGFKSTANTSGFSGTPSTRFTTGWTRLSLWWRGRQDATNTGFACPYIGIVPNNSDASPFLIASIDASSTGIQLDWNTAGTYAGGSATTALPNGAMGSLVGTFVVGGNAVLYKNGAQVASNAFGASAPTTGATPLLQVNDLNAYTNRPLGGTALIACVWERDLSAAEVAFLDREPYSFLIPDEGEMPALYLPPISGLAAITEASDTASATGALAITASLAKTEASDALAATGALALAAAAAISETSDTASATGVLALAGSAAIHEASDTCVATAALALKGVAAITEASDSLVATGSSAAIVAVVTPLERAFTVAAEDRAFAAAAEDRAFTAAFEDRAFVAAG